MTKFWKPLLAIALICALALAGLGLAAQSPAAAAQAERADEFRAVWVATVYRLDYPSQATTDPAVLKRDADAILQGCVDMGMNAVILQVRPSADALYPSELYPWSKYLTGAQGTAPKNGFDPLAYWVERAHALGLELHAWVNPFRITKGGAAEFQALTADHPAKLHPDWVVEYEGDYYFNPGLPEVREYIVRGAEELARKYDIDGIHLDDYFYPGSGFADGAPMPSTARAFPTSATGAGTMSTSWSRHWGSASTPLIRGCPTASAPPACGRIRAACPRAPIPPAAMRATTPPTPTAGNGSRRGGSTTSAPRSTGTSATRAWTTPRWPAGGRIR